MLLYYLVLESLVLNGELFDDFSIAGRVRSLSVQELVMLLPAQKSFVLWIAFKNRRLPSVMILLSLNGYSKTDECHDNRKNTCFLSLMKSILIFGNNHCQTWFTQYMKLMQQKVLRNTYLVVTSINNMLLSDWE